MKTWSAIFAMLKADFLERIRRSGFLLTLCLAIYLGYAVNIGQIVIKLDTYRGIYNAAWVGSLMSLVITFFLGLTGFFLVKNTVERDERTGVGQIIAASPITRAQYLLGKWLSNFAVLGSLVGILALAGLLMLLIQRETPQIQIWPLLAPFLFIALPMMALVGALAVLFEAIPWLKGGFGNLVYFGLFLALFLAGIFLTQAPWLDVTGISMIGTSMKAAAKAAFPSYQGSFTLAMISDQPLQTFVWSGVRWAPRLIAQRLAWLPVSLGVTLLGALFFDRFDPSGRVLPKRKRKTAESSDFQEGTEATSLVPQAAPIIPLALDRKFHSNILTLVRMECRLLVKGLKWWWFAALALMWAGCVFSPGEAQRKYWFMLIMIWPVLVWSKMGAREARFQVEQLIYQAAAPFERLTFSAWLAGVLITAAAASGVLLGRLISKEPLYLLSWTLAVIFIPSLAISAGAVSRGSKLFEVVYPILWYLGPFNRENGLAVLDFLGIHNQAPAYTSPLLFAGTIGLLVLCAAIARRRLAYC